MKSYDFKLYFPSGKTFMTQPFDDKNFVNRFSAFGSKVLFTEDTVITIAEYSSEYRACEVLDGIVNAYHAHNSFTLPKE